MSFKHQMTLLCIIFSIIFSFETLADQMIEEPAARYELVIDGEVFVIEPETTLQIDKTLVKPRVQLKVLPEKLFDFMGIKFSYPANFSFDADMNSDEVKLFTLTGRDSVIMVQRFYEPMDHAQMAAMIQPNYGDEISRVFPGTINLQGEEVEGSVIAAAFAGMALTQEIYSFSLHDGSVLLILQNQVDHTASPGAEGKKARALLENTFTLKPENKD